MQLDRLTIKSQEAVQAAQRLAEQHRSAELDVEHLGLALLDQAEGVVRPLVERLGVNVASFRPLLEKAVGERPVVEGAAERHPSRGFREVVGRAADLAGQMKDEYISTEHLFLAALAQGDSAFARLARQQGITQDAALKALQAVRAARPAEA